MNEFGPIPYMPPARLPESTAPVMPLAQRPVDALLPRRQLNTALSGEMRRRLVIDFKQTVTEGLLLGFRVAGFLGIIHCPIEDDDERHPWLTRVLESVDRLKNEEAASDEKLRELIGEQHRRSLRQNQLVRAL
jgi:hypothetical protein